MSEKREPRAEASPRGDILERNLDQLLTRAGEPPRLEAQAKEKIRRAVLARGRTRALVAARARLFQRAGFGLAALAAAASLAWIFFAGADAAPAFA